MHRHKNTCWQTLCSQCFDIALCARATSPYSSSSCCTRTITTSTNIYCFLILNVTVSKFPNQNCHKSECKKEHTHSDHFLPLLFSSYLFTRIHVGFFFSYFFIRLYFLHRCIFTFHIAYAFIFNAKRIHNSRTVCIYVNVLFIIHFVDVHLFCPFSSSATLESDVTFSLTHVNRAPKMEL